MPRKRVVTRTIKYLRGLCLILNIETGEITERNLDIPFKTYKKNEGEKLLNDFQKIYDTDIEKIRGIIKIEEHTEIFGMTEAEFISKAHKLADNRKMPEEKEREV